MIGYAWFARINLIVHSSRAAQDASLDPLIPISNLVLLNIS